MAQDRSNGGTQFAESILSLVEGLKQLLAREADSAYRLRRAQGEVSSLQLLKDLVGGFDGVVNIGYGMDG